MEPPAKRRRMSQWLPDKENVDEGDDELALQPFEVEAKRDPDYKLSVERAYADQRFQATMAHIFDKYGRDFDGIGDEIDLVTGEIVVNNGHVRNMRDEGDVGDGLGDGLGDDLGDGLGEEEDDEDEGILLEDLFDEEEEYGYEDTREQEKNVVVFEKRPQDNNDTDEEDEDRIIQGREAFRELHSTALVLGSSSGNALGVSRTALRTLPHHTPKGNLLDFEPPTQLPFTSSPFSFDRSPFAMETWSLSGQYSDPLWNQPDLFAVHQPQNQQFPIKASRYHFPAQSGQSSIWAPRSKFRDKEDEPLQSVFAATFGKHLLTRRKKILRHALPLPPTRSAEDDDKGEEEEEEDEDVILTGKRSKEDKSSDNTLAKSTKNSDGLQHANSLSSVPRKVPEERGVEGGSSDSGYKSTQSTRKDRKRKQRPYEDIARNEALIRASETSRRISHPESENDYKPHQKPSTDERHDETDGRRRSGRMRKQVEFLNKISWTEVLAEQRAEKETANSRNRLDRQPVEAEGSPEPVSAYEKQSALVVPEKDYIPDSAEEEEGEEEEEEGTEGGEEEGEEEKDQTSFHTDLPILHESEIRQADILDEPRAQIPGGFPRKNTDSACLLSDDEAPTLLSKSRRPISGNTPKSMLPLREIQNVKTQTGVKASSPDIIKAKGANHSRKGRTNTKDVIVDTSPIANRSRIGSDGHLDILSENSSGVAPLSSSPTRFLSRITLEVSLDDKPQASDISTQKARYQPVAIPSSSPCARKVEDTPRATVSKQKRRQSKKPVSSVAEQLTTSITNFNQSAKLITTPTIIEDSSYETSDDIFYIESSPAVEAPLRFEPTLPSPRRTASPPEAVTRALTKSPSKMSSKSPFKSPTKSPSKRTPSTHPSQLLPVDKAEKNDHVTSLPSLSNPPQTPRHSNRYSLKVPSSRHSILSLLSDDEDEEVDELGRNLAAMPKLLSSAAQTTARKVWKSSSLTREIYHTPVKKRPSEPISPGSIIKTPGGTLRACGVGGYRCGRDFCFTCL